MEPVTLSIAILGAALGVASLIISIRAERRASAVRNERLVRFEFVQLGENKFGFRNVGTQTARWVQIDPDSLRMVAIDGMTIFGECVPWKVWTITLTPAPGMAHPQSVLVTWKTPFQGEQHVPLLPTPATGALPDAL